MPHVCQILLHVHGSYSRAGEMLAQIVMQVIAYPLSFALTDFQDFLFETFAFSHFFTECRSAFLNARFQCFLERLEPCQQCQHDHIECQCDHPVPCQNERAVHASHPVAQHPNADA